MIRVLFVCTGNICRSPTAEAVFRHLLHDNKLDDHVEAASAGTHGYHVGEAPDRRMQRAAARRGYDLSGLRARRVTAQDIERFDLVLAMDRTNLKALKLITAPGQGERLALFMDYAASFDEDEVPDPYYGAEPGFERVLDMVEEASRGLVDQIKKEAAWKRRGCA